MRTTLQYASAQVRPRLWSVTLLQGESRQFQIDWSACVKAYGAISAYSWSCNVAGQISDSTLSGSVASVTAAPTYAGCIELVGQITTGGQILSSVFQIFVERAPTYGEVLANVIGTVFWGAWADQGPTGSEIAEAWESRQVPDSRGEYPITDDIAGNYWGIAVPAHLYLPDVIYAAGFAVGMQTSDIVIDGIDYRLYMSPAQTEADELELEIR